jgi:hypothetical protein
VDVGKNVLEVTEGKWLRYIDTENARKQIAKENRRMGNTGYNKEMKNQRKMDGWIKTECD